MLRRLLLSALLLAPPAQAQNASPSEIEVPSWFALTFLDLREDVRDAAKDKKRVLLYFGQDGCPYCARLMQVNFRQQAIVDKTRRDFVPIALNIWGDREVTWVDGRVASEKALAQRLKVQFTPTLLFLDEKGGVVFRLNGYYQPAQFEAVLDFASGRSKVLKTNIQEKANPTLNPEPFFSERRTGKPRAVFYETPYCAACDEMHREGLKRKEVLAQIARFDVQRVDASRGSAKLTYVPTIVFYDLKEREVFRVEAYVRPFHLAGAFAYVASGAYLKEPSFQRFLQAEGERIRAEGRPVELWK